MASDASVRNNDVGIKVGGGGEIETDESKSLRGSFQNLEPLL